MIDWKKFRDKHVPEVSKDDPALARIRAQLAWLDTHPAPEGNDPIAGMPYAELYQEMRQMLLDEIERYRWQKVGFDLTQEMRDALREEA